MLTQYIAVRANGALLNQMEIFEHHWIDEIEVFEAFEWSRV